MAIPSGILTPEESRFQTRNHVWFYVDGIRAFLFVPAALVRQFEIFLIGLFSIGTGLAILQTAANPYVTIIGLLRKCHPTVSIMGICNKFAKLFLHSFRSFNFKADDSELFSLIESGTLDAITKSAMLDELIQRVIVPYAILGGLLVLVGIGIRYSILRRLIQMNKMQPTRKRTGITLKSIFDFPYLILGALAIFFHVGTQVIAIDPSSITPIQWE